MRALVVLLFAVVGCTTPIRPCGSDLDCRNGTHCSAGACVPNEDAPPGSDAPIDAPVDAPLGADTGTDAPIDAPGPAVLRTEMGAPDLSCLGMRTLEPGSRDLGIAVQVVDGAGAPLTHESLSVGLGWTDTSTCTSCLVPDGVDMLLPEGATISAHALLSDGFTQRWYGLGWAATLAGTLALPAYSAADYAALGDHYGVASELGLLTRIADCRGATLENARVEVHNADAELTPFVTVAYVTDGLEATGPDGLALLLAPAGVVGTGTVRVELWGRTEATLPEVRIGCEDVVVASPGVTFAFVGPMRSDYGPATTCN